MHIRFKLGLITTASLVTVLAVAVTAIWSMRVIASAIEAQRSATVIAQGVGELLILTQEYQAHGEPRAQVQWETLFKQLRQRLEAAGIEPHFEHEVLQRMSAHLSGIEQMFGRLTAAQANSAGAALSQRLRQGINDRLLIDSQLLAGDAFRLAEYARARIERTHRVASLLVLAVVIVFALAIVVIAAVLRGNVINPLARLQAVTERIGAGDFQHVVPIASNDEVGALARAFETMRVNLRETTVSRDRLRREVEDRRRVEGELRRARDELEERVAQRTSALLEAKEKAEAADAAKLDFLARMSHELRTPLNAILGFAQILRLDADEGNKQVSPETVDHILQSGWHLLELVNDLLDLASVESGRLELHMKRVPLGEVVAQCLATIKPLAAARSIDCACVADCSASFVNADTVRLKQVLLNLLSNAVKFNREGGRIEVDCVADGEARIRVEVTDTGVGIAEDKLDQLFEPFSRLYLDTYAEEGTGIGLALVRQLVEAMGGEVGVRSVAGQGSTFWFELNTRAPLRLVAERPQPQEQIAQPDAVAGSGHVLLYIEDSPSNVALVENILGQQPGVQVISANTPELGLELAHAHRPDLILLDIRLPGMDGYAVLQKLRQDATTRDIPVIALSADAMPDQIQEGLNAGFRDYLTKPIDVATLRKTVRDILA